MDTNSPKLPEGFTLDEPASTMDSSGLPEGFTLDPPARSPAAAPAPSSGFDLGGVSFMDALNGALSAPAAPVPQAPSITPPPANIIPPAPSPAPNLSAPGIPLPERRPAPVAKMIEPELPPGLSAEPPPGFKVDPPPKSTAAWLLDGVTDPQEYAEVAKGIPGGAVGIVGTSVGGGAAFDLDAAYKRDVAKHSADILRIPDMTDEEFASLKDSMKGLGGTKFNPLMSGVAGLRLSAELGEIRSGKVKADEWLKKVSPPDVKDNSFYKIGKAINDFGNAIAPAAEGYEESGGRMLGQGFGSLLGALPIAAVGGPVGGGAFFGLAGVGEAQENAIAFDEAERKAGRKGLTQEQINLASLLGVGPGTTDMIAMEALLGRIPIPGIKELKTPLARAIGRIGGQTFIEGLQEGGQQFLQNLIAQEVYNPDQSLGEGVVPNTAVGGGVGAGAAVVRELLGNFAGRRRPHAPPPPSPEEPAAAAPAPDAPQAPEAPAAAQPEPVVPTPSGPASPAPAQAEPDEIAMLRGAGWSLSDIAAMSPEQRASEIEDALDSGVAPLTEDNPSAEPPSDILAQAEDLANPDNDRKAVWLPKASRDLLEQSPQAALKIYGSGVAIENFDGKGGVLVAQDEDVASKAQMALDEGYDVQQIVGPLVGSGTGKRVDATTVVQQKDADGSVTRETLVPDSEVASTETEFAAPDRTVETMPAEEALTVRAEKAAAEAGVDPFAIGLVPTYKTQGEAKLREALNSIESVDALRQMAKAQQIVLPKDLRRGENPDIGAVREAIINAVAGRVEDRAAGAAKPSADAVPGTEEAPIEVKTEADVAEAGAQIVEPTPAQAKSGDYAKGHIDFQGIDIALETPKGGTRKSDKMGKDGKPIWEVPDMPAAYGYVKSVKGKDGDELDVFVGDNPKSDRVFVIDQVDADTGKFDEHKVVLGTDTLQDAGNLYSRSYSDGKGPDRVGGITEMTMAEFKAWMNEEPGKAKKAPAARETYDGEPLSDEHIDSIVDTWSYVQEVYRRPKPQSLTGYIVAKGGVADPQGDVGSMADMGKGRPGLINKGGQTLDDAALDAYQAGFFPTRPSIGEFLEALDDDLRTGQFFRLQDEEVSEELKIADELAEELNDYGVTTNKFRTEASLRRYFGQTGERTSRPSAPVQAGEPTAGERESGVLPADIPFGSPEEEVAPSIEAEAAPETGPSDSEATAVPEGYSVELSDTRLKGSEAQQYGGTYKAIATRKSPWSVEDGYGNTPEEAKQNALGRIFRKEGADARRKLAQLGKKLVGKPQSEWTKNADKMRELADLVERAYGETELVKSTRASLEKIEGLASALEEASKIGAADFAAGKRNPSNQAMRDLIGANDGSASALMDAYTKAWDKANLAAPVEPPTITTEKDGQTTLAPPVTTAEEIAAAEKAKANKGKTGQEPADEGLFGEAGAQGDLVDLAKAPKKPVEAQEENPDQTAAKAEEAAPAQTSEETEAVSTDPKALEDAIWNRLLDDEGGFSNILDARKLARKMGFDGTDKQIEELFEKVVVKRTREWVKTLNRDGWPPSKTFKMLVEVYGNLPNLGTRTSTSVAEQAYSTPIPLAYVASRLADVSNADVVYEPSAGNGALLIEAQGLTIANELNPDRAAQLREVLPNARVTEFDATDPAQAKAIREKQDGADSVIMNPPFGAVRENGKSKAWTVDGYETTAVDHAIVLQGLQAMQDDGRAVLIIGGIKAENVTERRKGYRGKAKRTFFAKLYKDYGVVDHFTVSGDLYKKQGAGFPIDVIVIEGRKPSERKLPAAELPAFLKTWDEVGAKLNVDNTGSSSKPARGATEVVEKPNGRDESGANDAVRGGTDADSVQQEDKPGSVRSDGNQRKPGTAGTLKSGDTATRDEADRNDGATDEPAAPSRKPVKKETKGGQTTYVPASSANTLGTLIPQNMADAATSALNRVEDRHGAIDKFVADRLGFKSTAEMNKSIAAEQIDAVAMAMDNFDRGAAMIVGDQCVSGDTRIYDPTTGKHTAIKELAEIGKPITVLALTPEGLKPTAASAPFYKGESDLYRVTLEDGRTITVTRRHRFLTPFGWQTLDDGLREGCFLGCADGLPAKYLGISPSVRGASGLHLSKRPEDCLDDCSAYRNPCGEQPRRATDIGQALAPSQVDVLEHSRCYSGTGGQAASQEHTHRHPGSAHLSRNSSSQEGCRAPSLICTQVSASLGSGSTQTRQSAPLSQSDQAWLHQVSGEALQGQHQGAASCLSQIVVASEFLLRQGTDSHDEGSRQDGALRFEAVLQTDTPRISFGQSSDQVSQCDFPLGNHTGWGRVSSIEFVEHASFYDMWVPGHENYVAEGFINHNTGIGKGRTVASMIRFALRKGLVPVFVTEKIDLYGDMFRDMHALQIDKMLGRPIRAFATNTSTKVPLDEKAKEWTEAKDLADEAWKDHKEELIAAGKPVPKERPKEFARPKQNGLFLSTKDLKGSATQMAEIEASMRAGGEMPYDVVFTTYDQMNTQSGGETARREFIKRVMPNAYLIMDESHNAGGTKNERKKKDAAPDRAEFFRMIVGEAAGVLYSSATYAKRPDVMDLYHRTDMGQAVDNIEELPKLIQSGGVPMQQIVATMLSDSGQYARRERSFEGVEYAIEQVNIDQDTYKSFSTSVRGVFEFDKAVEEFRDEYMKDKLDETGGAQSADSGVGESSAYSIGFGSMMHNVVNQMLLAIKADQAADRVIKALKDNEKPVIGLSSTMEAFIKDYANAADISVGEVADLSFGDVLQRYLDRTLRITIKDANDKKTHIQIPVEALPLDLQRQFQDVKDLISNVNFAGMPVSPIDWIRHRVEKAGYSVAEVTGRATRIDYGGNAPMYVRRNKNEMGPSGKASSIGKFNRGSLDVLILNRSGSTGVSMHSSTDFKDQRRRRMVLVQAEGNIDTHLQMLGRVHRTGQITPPAYSHLAADIPAEARPIAVLTTKMASLNANTTGARGSAFMTEAADFINEVGDKIVARIIHENPELNDALGDPLMVADAEKGTRSSEDAAKRVTGKLTLLEPKEQQRLLDEIVDAYAAEINRLNALGENPLEAKTIDLQAKLLDTTVLRDANGEGPFRAATSMSKMSVKAQGRAMSPKEVVGAMAEFLGAKKPDGEPAQQMQDLYQEGLAWERKNRAKVEQQSKDFIAQEVAGMKPETRPQARRRLDDTLARWLDVSAMLAPGARVMISTENTSMNGVVMKLERRGKTKQPMALGSWYATIAIPDSSRTLFVPMSQIFTRKHVKGDNESGVEIAPSMVPYSGIISKLEDARREGREDRYIVTGNILSGFEQVRGKGQIVNFTMEDGALQPGILMSRDFQFDKFMDKRTVTLQTGEQVAKFLEKAPAARVTTDDGFVEILNQYGDIVIETAAARRTGGLYYTEPGVRDVLGRDAFRRFGNKMRASVTRSQLVRVVDAMKKALSPRFQVSESQDVAQEIVRADRPAPAKTQAPKPETKKAPNKKVGEFKDSVDSLKKKLGVKTKKLPGSDDGPLYALGAGAVLDLSTLRQTVEEMKRGSRMQVVTEAVVGFASDTDAIAETALKQAEIEPSELEISDLAVLVQSLYDLKQIIDSKVQSGYKLTDDISEIGDLLQTRMLDYASSLDTLIEEFENNQLEQMNEIVDRVDERLEEIRGPFNEDEDSDSLPVEYVENPDVYAFPDISTIPQDYTMLDVARAEVENSTEFIGSLAPKAEALIKADVEALSESELDQWRSGYESVFDLYSRLQSWTSVLSEKFSEQADEIFEAIDEIESSLLAPAVEKVEEAQGEIDGRLDEAQTELIEKKEIEDGQFIEVNDVEWGITRSEEYVAELKDRITRMQILRDNPNIQPDRAEAYKEIIESAEATIAEFNQKLAEFNSLSAIGNAKSDVRQDIAKRLSNGETITVPDEMVKQLMADVRKERGVAPKETDVAVMTRVKPIRGSGEVGVTFKSRFAGEITVHVTPRRLASTRAIFIPGDISVIGIVRFADDVQNPVGGEIWHESIHAHWRRLGAGIRKRLLSHANSVGVMQMPMREFLRLTGDPAYFRVPEDVTVEQVYRKAYAGASDLQDRIDQEAVAHTAELAALGLLTDEQFTAFKRLTGQFTKGVDAPVMAAYGRTDDTSRESAEVAMRIGRDFIVDKNVTRQIHKIIDEQTGVPEGSSAYAVSRIRRVGPVLTTSNPKIKDWEVEIVLEDSNGNTQIMRQMWQTIKSTRAFFVPSRGWIVSTRFGLFENFGKTVSGELRHEIVHARDYAGVGSRAVFDRLVAHAKRLRVLDTEVSTYLKIVGDPNYGKVGEGTLRESYEQLYSATKDADRRLDGEYVAHLVELQHHGELLPQEIEPVLQDILNFMEGGAANSPVPARISSRQFEEMAAKITKEPRSLGEYDVFVEPGPYTHYYVVEKGRKPWTDDGFASDHRIGTFLVKQGQIGGIEVTNAAIHDPALQRKGIGTKLYDLIESDFGGTTLMPAPWGQLSGAAYNFWKKRAPDRLKVIQEQRNDFEKGLYDERLMAAIGAMIRKAFRSPSAKDSPTLRVYHGSGTYTERFNDPTKSRHVKGVMFFGTRPETSGMFAYNSEKAKEITGRNMYQEGGMIYPLDITRAKLFDQTNADHRKVILDELNKGRFSTNTIDDKTLRAASWEMIEKSDIVRAIERTGFDGWISSEVEPQDTIAMFERGLVKSAITGDVMYALGAEAATGQEQRREFDKLGYYSKALEAAKGLKQEKGTPEQMLAAMNGIKQAELEMTGLREFLSGKKSVTKAEIVRFLRQNRVGLNEVDRQEPPKRTMANLDPGESFFNYQQPTNPTKFANYSLDPSNPTYRETVLHLPATKNQLEEWKVVRPDGQTRYNYSEESAARSAAQPGDTVVRGETKTYDGGFQSGHFPEPNIIGHMMTSMVHHEGKPTFLVDQIQSDWGQRLRDGGVRDEAKIAELTKAFDEAREGVQKHRGDANIVRIAGRYRSADGTELSPDLESAIRALQLAEAELKTADASVAGNPMVNTTDQWTNTTLRRALTQAVAADADYIAIPSGDTVLSYNPGDEDGMLQFYGGAGDYAARRIADNAMNRIDKQWHEEYKAELRKAPQVEGIVPKNLRKILAKLDKEASKPVLVDQLETPSRGMAGRGFTLFQITDKVKQKVRDEGLEMFSMLRRARKAVEPFADRWKAFLIERAYGSEQSATGRPAFKPSRSARLPSNVTPIMRADNQDFRDLYTQALERIETRGSRSNLQLVEKQADLSPFLDAVATISDGSSVTETDAYNTYVGWASSRGIEPVPLSAFSRAMSELGIAKARIAGRTRYIGLSFGGEQRSAPAAIENTEVRERISKAVNDAIEIVSRVAGPGVKVEFPSFISTSGAREDQRRGTAAVSGTDQAQGYGAYRPGTINGEALIRVAMGQPAEDIRTTAGHEAWHHVEEALSTEQERALMKSDSEARRVRGWAAAELGMSASDPALDEMPKWDLRAIAFQRYRRMREEGMEAASGLHIATRRAWDRIVRILRAVVNAVRGQGFDSVDAIFERARTGEMAQREASAANSEAEMFSMLPPAWARQHAILKANLSRTLSRASRQFLDPIRVKVQDKALPISRIAVERIEEATNTQLPDNLNTYLAEGLYSGRAGERLIDLYHKFVEPLVELLRSSEIDEKQLGDYLYARHAEERNLVIGQMHEVGTDFHDAMTNPDIVGGSGMSKREADQIMADVSASGKQAEYDAAAQMIDAAIKDSRDTLYRSGLIDKETHDNWSTQYVHYVPLREFEDGDSDDPARVRSGRGFDTRGPESMMAMGRRSKADNPVLYALLQAQQAIIRSEKNRVGKTLKRAVEAHPDPTIWAVYRGEMRRRPNQKTGLIETYWVKPSWANDQNVHGVKVGGKQHWIRINHPGLQRAMRGVGAENNFGAIGNAMMFLSRNYAKLLTSYNPEFVLSNLFRDIETALGNVGDIQNKPAGLRRKILSDATSLRAIRGAMAALRGDVSSEYAQTFEEFRLAGGKISFMEFNDVEKIRKDITNSLSRGRTSRAVRTTGKFVEDLNTAVENGVRLSVYKALRDNGVSKDRAAFAARELTVNFNRKGELSSGINALYIFFNASVQGSTRLLQAVGRSKAVRAAVGGIAATGFGLELLNALALSGDDDDDGKSDYDAIKPWIKERNIVVMLPGRSDYLQIPLAYGYNVPFIFGQQMGEVMRGKSSPLEAAANVVSAVIDSFNPVASSNTTFLQGVSPTILDPAVQVLENKTWYGGPIYPTKYDNKKPNSQNYFDSAPWWAVETSRIMNENTGGSVGRPGAIDVSPETIEHYIEFLGGGLGKFIANGWATGERMVNGEEWLPEKMPFVRRIYGKSSSTSRKREFYEAWDDVEQAAYEIKELKKAGQTSRALEARETYKEQIQVYDSMKEAYKKLKKLRGHRTAVLKNDSLSYTERNEQLEMIRRREDQAVQWALSRYHKTVKGN